MDLTFVEHLRLFRIPERWETVKLLEEHGSRTRREQSWWSVLDFAAALDQRMDRYGGDTRTDASHVALARSLSNTHLPLLDEHGILDYNESTNEVKPNASTITFGELLRAIESDTKVRDV